MNLQTIKIANNSSQPVEKISGSEAIIKCLLAEGVDVLYGYPGGAIMPFMMSCTNTRKKYIMC